MFVKRPQYETATPLPPQTLLGATASGLAIAATTHVSAQTAPDAVEPSLVGEVAVLFPIAQNAPYE